MPMSNADYIALALFIVLWALYSWFSAGSGGNHLPRPRLNRVLAERRKNWTYNSTSRDLKMIDTPPLAHPQHGTAVSPSAPTPPHG